MRVLACVIMSAWAAIARFRGDLVPCKISSCLGILGSGGGLELLTADVVALWLASRFEYNSILEEVNVGGL